MTRYLAIVLLALSSIVFSQVQGPLLNGINPNEAAIGDPDVSVTLTGDRFCIGGGSTAQYFAPGSQTPVNLPTTVQSETQAMATLSSSLLTTSGIGGIRMTNVAGSTCIFPGTTPSQTFIVLPRLQITTESIPNGVVGQQFTFNFSALGGNSPYLFSAPAGQVTPGLSVSSNGTLSGTPTTPGTFQVTVNVTDAAQRTATATFSHTITGGNIQIAPTTLPNGVVGTTYAQQLSATGGFPPYTWTLAAGALPPGIIFNAQAATLSGIPTTPGTYQFTIRANDTSDISVGVGGRTYQIVVTNPPLTITTTSLPRGAAGQPYNQQLQATGGTTPYTWSIIQGTLPAGLTLNPQTGVISGTPTSPSFTNLTVRVADSNEGAATRDFQLDIAAPTLAITTTSLPNGTIGQSYSQPLEATGGAGARTWSISQGALPAGLTLNAQTGLISGTPTTAGTSNFTARVQDATGAQATRALSITVNPAPLTITTQTLPKGTVGVNYDQTVQATGGVPPYAWSVQGTLPPGLSINAQTGAITGIPTTAGTFNFSVQVRDSSEAFATRAFAITIDPSTLTITTTQLASGAVGQPYSQQLQATGGTPPYLWANLGSLPAGLSLNAQTGVISGTPTAPGTIFFTAQVTDSNNVSAIRALSIAINPSTLTITTTELATGGVGQGYAAQMSATGGTPPYTWSIDGNLPAGLALNPQTGVISGIPTAAGTSNFIAVVRDSAQAAATRPLSIVINPATLTITTQSLANAMVGQGYSQPVQATGGTGGYAWSISAGALPAGLTINAQTGVISGIPTTAGSFNFTVQVTDSSAAMATHPFSIVVAPGALTIVTAQLPAVSTGTAYSQQLVAQGGVPPYTWSISGGSLPTGLNLVASTGLITGIPAIAGNTNFNVTVTDSLGATANRGFGLSIIESVPITLVITTNSLPSGTFGVPYSSGLAATGGTPPYNWSLVSGILPNLALDPVSGTITGTPNQAGTFPVTFMVTDAAGRTDSRPYSINIASTGITITTSTLPNGRVGVAYGTNLAASGGVSPYRWSVSAGSLPPGLSLSASGGISGTPTQAGSFSFTVRATDNTSPTPFAATKGLSITIAPAELRITTESLPNGTEGQGYGGGFAAEGGVPPYRWSIAGGSLPPGVSLAPAGTLSGTPTQAGSFSFTVQVTDNAETPNTVRRGYSIAIAPGPLTITTATLAEGVAGAAYGQSLAATGGTPPYTWSVVRGSLPAGLSLSSGGTISGTPTAAGEASVNIEVRDAAGRTTQRGFTISIVDALTITTTSLPGGVVGAPYSASLAATGGRGDYTFSVGSGSLPAGLSLNAAGAISGTPTAPGSFTIVARVTDAANRSATRSLTIEIVLPPVPAVTVGGPATVPPLQQPAITLTIANPYPMVVTGTLTLTFTSPSGVNDPSIAFSSGGRTANFTIPAGSTQGVFTPPLQVQVGTVAGTITITARLQSGGVDVTPTPAPTRIITIAPQAPVITAATAARSGNTINLTITGYSTPRDMSNLRLNFTVRPGVNVGGTEFNVALMQLFTTYYQSAQSLQFGSQFTLSLPITLTGDAAAVTGMSVTLTNSAGSTTAQVTGL